MDSSHDLFDSFSLLGMVVGTLIVPMAVLGTIFFFVKMMHGY